MSVCLSVANYKRVPYPSALSPARTKVSAIGLLVIINYPLITLVSGGRFHWDMVVQRKSINL